MATCKMWFRRSCATNNEAIDATNGDSSVHSYRNHLVCAAVIFAGSLLGGSSAALAQKIPFRHVVIDSKAPPGMQTKTAGDLNGDGLTDLVVAGIKGTIVWYESPGWKKHVIATSGGGWSTDAEVGDIDRDGDNDIVISDWYQKTRIVWFENPGKGEGNWPMHVLGGPMAHDIELGDLDGDKDLDIVTRLHVGSGNRFEVWLQKSPTSWGHRTVRCDDNGEGLTMHDLDKDGDPDVIIGARWYETPDNPDKAGWTEHVYTAAWKHKACVVQTGDFNKDGRTDIVISPSESSGGKYRVAWYEAPRDPKSENWTEHVIDPSVETVIHSLAVADMNGDGIPDVVTAEMHQGRNPDEVRVYVSSARGSKWTKQVVATSGSHNIRVIDVDGDGDFDIFGANWSGTTTVNLWENRSKR